MEDREQLLRFIREHKLVAIIRGVGKKYILDTAEAISNGGIKCLEITIDHSSVESIEETFQMISMVTEKFGDKLKIGAGTVLTVGEVVKAAEAGAKYIISPNTNVEVIKQTVKEGCISMPGAFTPSEIEEAYEAGADLVKIFPAGLLGTEYVKALHGPLGHIPLVAVGGINPKNCRDFLDAGCVGLGIGGNLARLDLIKKGLFDEIAEISRSFSIQI